MSVINEVVEITREAWASLTPESAPNVMYYSRTRFLTDGTTDRVECCANWWPPLGGAELLPDCTWSDGVFRVKLHWPDNLLA